jgi:UDP-glucose 4-epimerase
MATPLSILVTGGTGYVGSHAVVELMAAGYQIFHHRQPV